MKIKCLIIISFFVIFYRCPAPDNIKLVFSNKTNHYLVPLGKYVWEDAESALGVLKPNSQFILTMSAQENKPSNVFDFFRFENKFANEIFFISAKDIDNITHDHDENGLTTFEISVENPEMR